MPRPRQRRKWRTDPRGSRCLLVQSEAVRSFLPARFLKFVDSSVYNGNAIALLKAAGLSDDPASHDLLIVIRAHDLTPAEAGGVLKYLQEQRRWQGHYSIQSEFRGPWFPSPHGRITVFDAIARNLVDVTLLSNDEFKAWLGLRETSPEPPSTSRLEKRNANNILLHLHGWWQEERCGVDRVL